MDTIHTSRPLRAYRPFAARADMFEQMAAREGTERAVVLLGSVTDLARGVSSTWHFDVEIDYL